MPSPANPATTDARLSPYVLLLVEDDPTISELLAHNLRAVGYEVLIERDGRAGLESAIAYPVDLVILDLMLPELDGLTVSKEISRHKPELPIVILTARDERETALAGFESGADDYITKPFDLDQVLARIAARLRRVPRAATPELATAAPPAFSGFEVDSDARVIRGATGSAALNPKEHDLLALLISDPRHLFRREELVHKVWHQPFVSTSRSLDVHVRHLRVKLHQVGAPVAIQTVRGVGYRAVPVGDPQTPGISGEPSLPANPGTEG